MGGLVTGFGTHCLVVMVAAAACVPAWADGVAPSQGVAQPAAGDDLKLKLSADVTYDTNVARSSAAGAAARGLARDDFIYSPVADLIASKSLGQNTVYLSGQFGYKFYGQDTVLNRQSIDSEAGANLTIAECQANLSGDFGQHQTEIDYLGAGTTKDLTTITRVGLSANCPRSVGFAPFVSASREWMTESVQSTQNHNQYSVSGGVAYNHPVIGQISLFGQYQTVRYPKRQFDINGAIITDGYEVAAGGVRYARTLGTTIDVSASFSYTSVHPNSVLEPGFNGPAYDGQITYHPMWRLQLQANFSRAVHAAPLINASYVRDTSTGLHLTYRLNQKLSVEGFVQRASSDYRGAALVPGIDQTTQTTDSAGGSIRYALNDTIQLALRASTDNRSTDLALFNYSSTRVGLSLNVSL